MNDVLNGWTRSGETYTRYNKDGYERWEDGILYTYLILLPQPGDTLRALALRNGKDVAAVAATNGTTNVDAMLMPGSVIYIEHSRHQHASPEG